MKEPVIIKSYQMNGLKLVMDEKVPFEDILSSLAARLKKGGKFFTAVPKGLFFEGRELSLEEQIQVLACIRDNSELNIVCVMEEDSKLQEKINEKVKKACLDLKLAEKEAEPEQVQKNKDNISDQPSQLTAGTLQPPEVPKAMLSEELPVKAGMFYKGSLRSGQMLKSDQSIILLGDVKPGAKVVSGGNVVILGSLRGNVCAGVDGDKSAFVVAIDMRPVQVRIYDFIARSPDKPQEIREHVPKIAYLEGDNIYIEPVCRDILKDIQI